MVESILIRTTGEVERITPANGVKFTLDELQKCVGGYIEFVYLPSKKIMVVNEEGKYIGCEFNATATSLAHFANAIFDNDFIVGDVVVLHSDLLN